MSADLRSLATYGGPGWAPRDLPHAQELQTGSVWHRCGVDNEVGRLREVLLSYPSPRLAEVTHADEWLMVDIPDPVALKQQAFGLKRFYESQGVRVHLHTPEQAPPPNYLFMRDLIFMTPEGAVLARPAGTPRAGEERWAQQALAELGIPILRSLRGTATFEGADAWWVDPSEVLIGVGRRTNQAGFETVAAVLAEQGVAATPVSLPEGVQHFMGAALPVDRDLVLINGARANQAVRDAFARRGYQLLECPPSPELTHGLGMNVVVLSPRRIVMPTGCPRLRERFEAAGIAAFEQPMDQYIRAAGALGCCTAILRRDPLG